MTTRCVSDLDVCVCVCVQWQWQWWMPFAANQLEQIKKVQVQRNNQGEKPLSHTIIFTR